MRQSNWYIIMYSAALTILCGGLLAYASISLKDRQEANVALEQKSNILATVTTLKEGDDISAIYQKRVRAFVVDYQGNKKEGVAPESIIVAAEYKKKPEDRLLPVYEYLKASDPDKVESVVIPLYGFGLWNTIWGYVAFKSDFNTILGVLFQHAGETPGLGARIATQEIQDRFKNKQVFDKDNNVASIVMQKGEGHDYADSPHKVDGMSGATLTGKGVNAMLKEYFMCYAKYLKKSVPATTSSPTDSVDTVLPSK